MTVKKIVAKSKRLPLVAFRLTPELLARLDACVDGVRFRSRSHIITEMLNNWIAAREYQARAAKKGSKR
jgi:metal-responsive CopG/Arc/MetJ family transcriptional regulator